MDRAPPVGYGLLTVRSLVDDVLVVAAVVAVAVLLRLLLPR
jgi:hypothetical protein